jgi:hypothetical protein
MRQEDYAKPDEELHVPDLGQSIQIMPEAISKLGLLDGKTIGAVLTAYAMAEEYSAKLLLLGGRLRTGPRQLQALRRVAVKSSDATRSTE